MYVLEFSTKFVRAYKKLDQQTRFQVDNTLQLLVKNPKHPSLRLKRIQGTKDIWEISVNMSVRITLRLSENIIQLRNVGTHEQVFRPPY
ncbi:type II toxin-antitoxin system RelE/ParE family toxin [Desulfocucumis palustris]|uniref:type II toxin-antitoxin system RelE/ParE family toxin n=1 Tax=Desulfocucumis palustris TaxID=1898651 RepID=UPI000CEA4DD0|nr:hypothetical protein [Desulfocucumis palustris]